MTEVGRFIYFFICVFLVDLEPFMSLLPLVGSSTLYAVLPVEDLVENFMGGS